MIQKLTYRNFYFLFVAVILFFECCTEKVVTNKVDTSNITTNDLLNAIKDNQDSFKTVFVDKLILRFDYKGQLRTFRGSLYSILDSVFFVNVKTNFSSHIASFIAFPGHILLMDIKQKTIYELKYNTLQNYIGFPINFTLLQRTVLAKHDLIPIVKEGNFITFSNSNNNTNAELVYSFKEENIINSITHKYLVNVETGKPSHFDVYSDGSIVLLTNYLYKNSDPKQLKNVFLDFNYEREPLGIELEYKNFDYNLNHLIFIDSTYTFRYLSVDEN